MGTHCSIAPYRVPLLYSYSGGEKINLKVTRLRWISYYIISILPAYFFEFALYGLPLSNINYGATFGHGSFRIDIPMVERAQLPFTNTYMRTSSVRIGLDRDFVFFQSTFWKKDELQSKLKHTVWKKANLFRLLHEYHVHLTKTKIRSACI